MKIRLNLVKTEQVNNKILSFFQINLKVKQNAINVIFAVTAEQISVYEKLGKHIEGSTSGTLTGDSSNIVDLVQEQYNVSKIVINCSSYYSDL